MEAVFEHIGTGADRSWQHFVRRDDRFEFTWHFHRELELTYLIRGGGTRFVGDSVAPYQSGELVLLGSNLAHTFTSADEPGQNFEAIVAQFPPEFLGPTLLRCPEFRAVANLLDRADRGLRFPAIPPAVDDGLRRLERLDPAARTVQFLAVLEELSTAPAEPLASSHYLVRENPGTQRRIENVCRFLQHEYHRPLQLAEVAAVAHLSGSAFSRFFHRTMGTTLTAYLNELRIAAACRLLSDSELAVADIAAKVGYQNLSHFNRRFHHIKRMTPRQYRAHFRGEPVTAVRV